MHRDVRRMLDVQPEPADAGSEPWIDELARPRGLMSLTPHQRRALSSLRRRGAVVGALGVGTGKTLVAGLAPRALQIPGQSVVYLVPPTLVKTAKAEFAKYAHHFDIDPPTIVSYSALSATDAADVLDKLAPRAIIADEAHYLRHPSSARTRRVFRYLLANRSCAFCPMSGTLLGKSVRDAWHLFGRALGEGSPLPLDYPVLEALAQCTDIEGSMVMPSPMDWGLTRPLTDALGLPNDRAGARAAIERRIDLADGVVATTRSGADMALYIHRVRSRTPKPITDALKHLKAVWELPDGSPLIQATEVAFAASQLSTGFYYATEWGPDGPDLEWLSFRSTYQRALRAFLGSSGRRLRLDTPGAVERALATRGAVTDPVLIRAWEDWTAVKDRCDPKPYPVWITDTVVREAMALANKHDAILWYHWTAVGDRLAELGMEVIQPGTEVPDDHRRRPVAMSIQAHGTGKNLQAWSTSVILEPPVSGTTWEQLLGRTHRLGQTADAVEVHIWSSTQHQRDAVTKGIEGARFLEQSTGQPQKLLLATFCA